MHIYDRLSRSSRKQDPPLQARDCNCKSLAWNQAASSLVSAMTKGDGTVDIWTYEVKIDDGAKDETPASETINPVKPLANTKSLQAADGDGNLTGMEIISTADTSFEGPGMPVLKLISE